MDTLFGNASRRRRGSRQVGHQSGFSARTLRCFRHPGIVINRIHDPADLDFDTPRLPGNGDGAMFDRFTDRAKKVMGLARQEAQRFNHEYIGTEHILLGLVQEGSGVAANVLKNMDDRPRTRSAPRSRRSSRPAPRWSPWGSCPSRRGRRRCSSSSMEEASNLGHNYIGTEHLLLGPDQGERGHRRAGAAEPGREARGRARGGARVPRRRHRPTRRRRRARSARAARRPAGGAQVARRRRWTPSAAT